MRCNLLIRPVLEIVKESSNAREGITTEFRPRCQLRALCGRNHRTLVRALRRYSFTVINAVAPFGRNHRTLVRAREKIFPVPSVPDAFLAA